MEQNHIISIVIPAYNEEKYLKRCLESVNSQVCDLPFEVIVVDNNSTDTTAEIAVEFGARVIFEPIVGIARARQAGFDSALGSIIASVDADTLIPPQWLQILTYELITHPLTVAVTCPAYYTDHRFMYILTRLWYKLGYPLTRLAGRLTGRGYFPLSAPCYVIWAEVLRKVGGLDITLQTADDADLSLKLEKQGTIVFLEEVYVETSARRFKNNFFGTSFIWLINYISMSITGRIVINKYPHYR